MRFLVHMCNLAGILGVSNSYTLQNGPCVPPHPTLAHHPSFLPPAQEKEKVIGTKAFVQINNEFDTALGCQLYIERSTRRFWPHLRGRVLKILFLEQFSELMLNNGILCVLAIFTQHE